MKKTLFEELSISNEIRAEAENLVHIILLTIDNAKKITYDKYRNVLADSIKISLFGTSYLINYKIFDIQSSKQFDEHLFKILTPITRNNVHEVDLFLLTINGTPDPDMFYAPIYHEMVHIYQFLKSEKDVLENATIKNLYRIMRDVQEQCVSNGQQLFSNALYASFDFEQDALIHELYGECMHRQETYTLHQYIWMSSNAYEFINDLRCAIENIDELDETLFEKPKNYYLTLFQKKLARFENKLGKLETKIKKDFFEKHLNEGLLPGNIHACSMQLTSDMQNIKNFQDDEVF